MATTTNYGWTTPDDTALVKDGASAIRTLGTSVDTTTKNLNPETTLGDIAYRSSTSNVNTRVGIGTSGQALTVVAGAPSWAASPPSVLTTTGDSLYASSANTLARLGIGSTGQVLTVSGGLPTWATAATPSSGANFISRTSFSASATVTIDSIFSGTYENYIVDCQITGSANLNMRGRYSTTTHTAANYQYAFCGIKSDSATLIGRNAYDQTSWDLGSSSSQGFFGTLFFYRNSSSGHLYFQGFTLNRSNGNSLQGSGFIESNQLWTGLNWFPASGTLTGQVSCYGLAAS